jgi:hypothetical protein
MKTLKGYQMSTLKVSDKIKHCKIPNISNFWFTYVQSVCTVRNEDFERISNVPK